MKVFIIPRIKGILVFAFWMMLWHVASAVTSNTLVIVSPFSAFGRLSELAFESFFWHSIGISLGRIILGFLLALVIGVLLAALSAANGIIYALFRPLADTIKSVPVASFTILALMWLNPARLPLFIAFITVLPIVYFNTYEGIRNTDPKILEMSALFNVPRWRRIRFIFFPSTLPHVIAAANAGLGFAFKSGIAAEVIGIARNTIGFNLHTARIFLQTRDVFAWTIAICILSFVMERIFLLLLRKFSQ